MPHTELPPPPTSLLWDIFCRVVDNWGDIGVCWRLATNLAAHGQRVRLWVDDPSALRWMAPCTLEGDGVEVLPWDVSKNSEALRKIPRADVWVETFGCEIAAEFISHHTDESKVKDAEFSRRPVWVNLEHLSAEGFVERNHGLPSPIMQGPAAGWNKYFFYPGFTEKTGGLLREFNLHGRQANFDKAQWLTRHGVEWKGARLISMFCYEPSALPNFLQQLRTDICPTQLLVTAGKASHAVRAVKHMPEGSGALSIVYLPPLTQLEYDELLWACDFNCVRGEDSVIRALWANKPFVWQLYPQEDAAHYAKLDAFLDVIKAPPCLRRFHHIWNAPHTANAAISNLPKLELADWQTVLSAARMRLLGMQDLCTQLLRFVLEKR